MIDSVPAITMMVEPFDTVPTKRRIPPTILKKLARTLHIINNNVQLSLNTAE